MNKSKKKYYKRKTSKNKIYNRKTFKNKIRKRKTSKNKIRNVTNQRGGLDATPIQAALPDPLNDDSIPSARAVAADENSIADAHTVDSIDQALYDKQDTGSRIPTNASSELVTTSREERAAARVAAEEREKKEREKEQNSRDRQKRYTYLILSIQKRTNPKGRGGIKMVAKTITACASYDTKIIKSPSNDKYYILDPGGVMDAALGARCSTEVDYWNTTVGELEDHYLRKGDEVLTVDSWRKFKYFAEHFNIRNEKEFMEHINKGHETKIKARRMEWYHNGKLLTEGQHRELITNMVDENDPNIDYVFDKVDVSPDVKQTWHDAVHRIANALPDPGILFNKLVQDQVNDWGLNNLAQGREERIKNEVEKVPLWQRSQARKEWNELEDLATAQWQAERNRGAERELVASSQSYSGDEAEAGGGKRKNRTRKHKKHKNKSKKNYKKFSKTKISRKRKMKTHRK